jgi:hypothetical protein
MHGGASGSGAPRKNQNARERALCARGTIAGRKQVQAVLGDARKLLREMKFVSSG